ncbi:MAG: hypothetical protein KAJ44_07015 [Thermoplasmatales archaeon]|nr:hypothetical protein [Thermoplasmatales archaeon]
MKNNVRILIMLVLLIFSILVQSVAAENTIVVDYYYSTSCGSCKAYTEGVIDPIEANFSGKIIVNRKDVKSNTKDWNEWRDHGFKSYPAATINNETKVPKSNLTYETLEEIINAYLAEVDVNHTFDDTIIDIPFIGSVNTSGLSLPILTIVLGVLDSFNPCSFFILIFLLNLLLYVQSRRRMLLVGGIFIFFSGFFYFLFMFILFNSFLLTSEHISTVSLLAGAVALIIGIVNIKDFFFFKKGPSLSIPESKKPEVFKKMRNLVKTSYLPAIIGGTIFLAVTVNFYELLCTLGFPLIFTNRLTSYTLPLLEYYIYIFFYNVVYVIPLMIILLVFVYTLGRRKLTEWQGQKLKLLSGIMIFSFGLLFIIDHTLLENVAAPILLLVVSIISTVVISYVWKKYKKQPEEKQEEES